MKSPKSLEDIMEPQRFKEWFDIVLSIPNGEFDCRFGDGGGEVLVDGFAMAYVSRGVEGACGWVMQAVRKNGRNVIRNGRPLERMICGVVIFKPHPRSMAAIRKVRKFVYADWSSIGRIDNAEWTEKVLAPFVFKGVQVLLDGKEAMASFVFPDTDEHGPPVEKMPNCPRCGEDELAVITRISVLCYQCGWRFERDNNG